MVCDIGINSLWKMLDRIFLFLFSIFFKKIFPRNMGINKQISRFMSKFDVRFFLIFVDIHFRIISREGDDLCVNQ